MIASHGYDEEACVTSHSCRSVGLSGNGCPETRRGISSHIGYWPMDSPSLTTKRCVMNCHWRLINSPVLPRVCCLRLTAWQLWRGLASSGTVSKPRGAAMESKGNERLSLWAGRVGVFISRLMMGRPLKLEGVCVCGGGGGVVEVGGRGCSQLGNINRLHVRYGLSVGEIFLPVAVPPTM